MLRTICLTGLLLIALLLPGIVPAQAAPAPPKQQLSLPAKQRIVIYVADGWGYCSKAERYFAKLGIPFEVRDIQHNDLYFQEWQKNFQGEIVPVIVFDNGKQVVDGFDIRAIKRAMKEVGIAPPPN